MSKPSADELIGIFRAEVTRRRENRPAPIEGAARPNLPAVRDLPVVRSLAGALSGDRNGQGYGLPPFLAPTWWRSVDPKTERIKALAAEAKQRSNGPASWPKFLRSIFRKQGGINRALIDGVLILAKTNEQLTRQAAELSAACQAQGRWLESLSQQVTSGPIKGLHDDLFALRTALQTISRDLQMRVNELTENLYLGELRGTDRMEELRETRWNLLNLAEDVATIEARLKDVAATGGTTTDAAKRIEAAVTQLRVDLSGTGADMRESLRSLAEQANTLSAALPAKADVTSVGRVEGSIARVEGAFAQLEERVLSDAVFIKAQLSRLRTNIDQLEPKPAAKRNPRRSQEAPESPASSEEVDAFYLAFENQFRGDRADIKRRLQVYLPFLREAKVSGETLDVGCGRGEWLELLTEQGMSDAKGVDLNSAMVEQCAGRGLQVMHADALEHVRSLPENSLAAVTSFHLIEHLSLRMLLHLLSEILRALQRGGLVILETPNPRNILVGASDFFRDPTHNHPIHPDTIRFMLETVGFADVKCYFLADAEERTALPEEDFVFADLQSYVDVPRDFAVIARKA